MLAEHELFFDSDNVFLVFRVVIPQLVQYFGLNQSLFVQPFLIAQDFQSHEFLVLVVEAFEHLAKAAFSKSICNLKSIANMLAFFSNVFVLIVVEAVIVHAVGGGRWTFLLLSFVYVEPIYGIIVKYFLFFNFHQVFREIYNGCSRIHWKLQFFLQIV